MWFKLYRYVVLQDWSLVNTIEYRTVYKGVLIIFSKYSFVYWKYLEYWKNPTFEVILLLQFTNLDLRLKEKKNSFHFYCYNICFNN